MVELRDHKVVGTETVQSFSFLVNSAEAFEVDFVLVLAKNDNDRYRDSALVFLATS